jgi:hypothetical protein
MRANQRTPIAAAAAAAVHMQANATVTTPPTATPTGSSWTSAAWMTTDWHGETRQRSHQIFKHEDNCAMRNTKLLTISVVISVVW